MEVLFHYLEIVREKNNVENFPFFVFRYFLYFFDVVIFVNAVFIALSQEMAEAAFLLLFNIELFLKFYTYGCREFFVNFWNT